MTTKNTSFANRWLAVWLAAFLIISTLLLVVALGAAVLFTICLIGLFYLLHRQDLVPRFRTMQDPNFGGRVLFMSIDHIIYTKNLVQWVRNNQHLAIVSAAKIQGNLS